MTKILFVAAHRPNRSPSQRFRFEQYLNFLEQNGFEYEFSYIISEKDDKVFYKPGNYATKFKVWQKGYRKRLEDAKRADEFDIVFVQREAFMTGSTRFEKKFGDSKAKFVYDFDDSIWLSNVSDANKELEWLKDYDKTSQIIGMADLVLAGNTYLADYAKQFNSKVKVIPTTIDTDRHTPYSRNESKKSICIGWTGSSTTIQHYEYAIPFLRLIKKKYGKKVSLKVIGDKSYKNEELGIEGIPWTLDDELEQLNSINIGIMPLPDDEWAKGKCGLKGLQYMALEIPTIMSPVGVNTEIIENGVNGYLAEKAEEWVEIIAALIESAELRKKIGQAARRTVIESYSVESQKDNYLQCFNEVLET